MNIQANYEGKGISEEAKKLSQITRSKRGRDEAQIQVSDVKAYNLSKLYIHTILSIL